MVNIGAVMYGSTVLQGILNQAGKYAMLIAQELVLVWQPSPVVFSKLFLCGPGSE